jgi:hypothetical protein
MIGVPDRELVNAPVVGSKMEPNYLKVGELNPDSAISTIA